MSNKFHRSLTDDELHTPERSGVGNPNESELLLPVNGQYYQDTDTGSVWRYRVNEANINASSWELLLDYDKETGLLSNTQQNFQVETSKIGETRSDVLRSRAGITSIDANLFTEVRTGEEIYLVNSANTEQSEAFTVSNTTAGGETTIEIQLKRPVYEYPSGSAIYLDGALFSTYQSTDPTKIFSSISEEREAKGIGVLSRKISAGTEINTVYFTLESGTLVQLRRDQILFLYGERGKGQYVEVFYDYTLQGTGEKSILVGPTTAQIDYFPDYSFLEEPAWWMTTQVTQTSNALSFLATTTNNVLVAIAGINATTNVLNASVTTLALVNDGQNTAIATAQTSASGAFAAANTSVKYATANGTQGAYIQLIAGAGGSNITISADQVDINSVVNFVNTQDTTTIDGGKITTNSITADQINVANLFSQSIDVGNVIKSANYDVNNGFAVYSNGSAVFRDIVGFSTPGFAKNTSGVGLTDDGLEVNRRLTIGDFNSIGRLDFVSNTDALVGRVVGFELGGGALNALFLVAKQFSGLSAAETLDGTATNVSAVDLSTHGGGNETEVTASPKLVVDPKSTGNQLVFHAKGDVRIDGTVSNSATAGSNGSVPAQVEGYLTVNIDGTNMKIPYFKS